MHGKQPVIEDYTPGHQRRFVFDARGVIVDTRFALTPSKTEKHWSQWSFWGRYPTLEEARQAHDNALS